MAGSAAEWLVASTEWMANWARMHEEAERRYQQLAPDDRARVDAKHDDTFFAEILDVIAEAAPEMRYTNERFIREHMDAVAAVLVENSRIAELEVEVRRLQHVIASIGAVCDVVQPLDPDVALS